MNSFGHRFGRLVKNKRGIEGLSQQALAALAFDDESRKTRISELENGKISNPHQKTVDALVIALEISKEELDACHLQAGAAAELGLRRELLESLVLRFEHDNPDAPDQELSRFLKNKAAELKELKARLSALADGEARIANQIAAAQGALDEALFDEADEILRTAEEMQQEEHTLKQVRKQAEIRAARAQAALLKGDTGAAYAHYTTAIQYFEPFDPLEAAAQRRSFGTTLREHGERFGGAGLTHAIALAELNLITYSKQAHPQDWAMTQNNLAGALQIMGKRAGGAEGLKALERAVAAYENALQVYTHDDMPADWAMTQNNLANALQVMGDRAGGAEGLKTLERAVTAYENALEVRTRDHMPAQWAATQMNLGNTLAILGEREESAARLQGALEALRNARLIFVDAAGDDQYAPYFDGRIEAVEALLAKRGPDETS
jgi:tetratricopeptide (TPR) repeat protein